MDLSSVFPSIQATVAKRSRAGGTRTCCPQPRSSLLTVKRCILILEHGVRMHSPGIQDAGSLQGHPLEAAIVHLRIATTPAKGTFVPWAEGPRNCPGQRFAQVEFVAVLGTLFSAHRLKPVLSNGRTAEDAKKDLLSMADGAGISAVSLQMQEPKKVALQWAGSS